MNTAQIERILRRHNPENDTRRDGPPVTWAEADIAALLLKLVAKVEQLESQMATQAAAQLGSIRSKAKARAARENGRKGGRPRKIKPEVLEQEN